MAKKATPAKKSTPSSVAKSTPIRNTSIPKSNSAPAAKKPPLVTRELIAQRAYFISISGNGGSQEENWLRAERELRGGLS